jgi:hypothetical protein
MPVIRGHGAGFGEQGDVGAESGDGLVKDAG